MATDTDTDVDVGLDGGGGGTMDEGAPKAPFKDSHTEPRICVFMWHLQVAAATTPTISRFCFDFLTKSKLYTQPGKTIGSERERKREGETERKRERVLTEKRQSDILRFGKCIPHPSEKKPASLMPLQIARQSARVQTFR